ncbi:hypothetical protein KUCAC02_026900, partial [Chaenocephalus aceratus]
GASLNTDITTLTSAECTTTSGCLSLLSGFNEATIELSEEKHVSGSKAARREAPHTPLYEHHVIGNAMDPRFKLIGSFSPLKAAEATERLVTECGALIRTPEAVQPQESPSTSRPEQETSTAGPRRVGGLSESRDIQVNHRDNVRGRFQASTALRSSARFQRGIKHHTEGTLGLHVSNGIKAVLEPLKLREKLIAQTYDGAAVMSGNVRGVQTVTKETYPNATHEATQRRIPATGCIRPVKETAGPSKTDALAATAHDGTDEPGRRVSSTVMKVMKHVRSCPPPELDCAVELWPALGNKERLKSELTTLCRRSELHTGSTARSLLKSIHENNLEDTFAETLIQQLQDFIPKVTALWEEGPPCRFPLH